MSIKRFAQPFRHSILTLALLGAAPWATAAQDSHSQPLSLQSDELIADQRSQTHDLIKRVREATERFQDVREAGAAGYALAFGCVSGDTTGAMGLHYLNMDLVTAGAVDVRYPQIVIYEPTPSGHLRLVGADYLVMAEQWNATHPGPPQLMGQLFHLFPSPNRFGLPAFYTLHVWAWKDNPNGAFVNWHPNVSCESFVDKTTR